jgi:hypothetical protein
MLVKSPIRCYDNNSADIDSKLKTLTVVDLDSADIDSANFKMVLISIELVCVYVCEGAGAGEGVYPTVTRNPDKFAWI